MSDGRERSLGPRTACQPLWWLSSGISLYAFRPSNPSSSAHVKCLYRLLEHTGKSHTFVLRVFRQLHPPASLYTLITCSHTHVEMRFRYGCPFCGCIFCLPISDIRGSGTSPLPVSALFPLDSDRDSGFPWFFSLITSSNLAAFQVAIGLAARLNERRFSLHHRLYVMHPAHLSQR